MELGKVHTYSIIMVRYENGATKWYKTKKGRNINSIVNHFSRIHFYKWLKIFEFSRSHGVGRKYFYHTKSGNFGFN